jgi:NADPH-dependent curcumin reductase CurA
MIRGCTNKPDLHMNTINRQFRIAARPVGMVKESDFAYTEVPIPDIRDGEARVRTTCLSILPCADKWKTAQTTWRRSQSAT